jgi:NAD(P)-dependent dehydrogenase (short-subunit alcohol dehydrogenase family)
MKLEQKVVIVTGGAVGIGRAYARRFLEEGARVLVADVVDPTDAVKDLGAHGEVHGVRTDVAAPASAQAMAEAALARWGRIDVLVNNAAVFAALRPKPFEQIDEAEWDRVMAVNVKGVWNCARAVVPAMRRQKAGRIVNVASAIVAKGTPGLMHYVTSKGAVIALTRALARELGPDGIGVNALAPGLVMSDTVRGNPAIFEFQQATVLQSRALRREQVPEDLVGAAVFLAGDDSAFMTGQTLIVDGGSVFQ